MLCINNTFLLTKTFSCLQWSLQDLAGIFCQLTQPYWSSERRGQHIILLQLQTSVSCWIQHLYAVSLMVSTPVQDLMSCNACPFTCNFLYHIFYFMSHTVQFHWTLFFHICQQQEKSLRLIQSSDFFFINGISLMGF